MNGQSKRASALEALHKEAVGNATLYLGDCREVLPTLADESIDSIVVDPPYELGFMGKKWDKSGIAFDPDTWRHALRVLKPGGHMLAFGGSRTFHRIACAIEDAGFEIRDTIMWLYGSGFPKSLDVNKAIDKHGGQSVAWFGPWFRKWREERGIAQKEVAALFPSKSGGLTGCVANWELGLNMPTPEQFNLIRDTFGLPFDSIAAAEHEVVGRGASGLGQGRFHARETGAGGYGFSAEYTITSPATDAARQWQGWGTALKPAFEPIILARKPLAGTVAANVMEHGTGALNIDACRVQGESTLVKRPAGSFGRMNDDGWQPKAGFNGSHLGRWPANIIHDGSEEVLAAFPSAPGQLAPVSTTAPSAKTSNVYGKMRREGEASAASRYTDAGGTNFAMMPGPRGGDPAGRWPANVIHDGSDEVLAAFPESEVSGSAKNGTRSDATPAGIFGKRPQGRLHNDAGSAARFFYCAKASRKDRDEGLDAFDEVASRNYRTGNVHNGHGGRVPDKTARNTHPTVKPTSLMRYLCRLVTPPGGTVLDFFMGSGSTGKAAVLEDFSFIGVEQDEHSYEIAKARIQHAQIQHDEQPGTLQAELFT